MSLWLMAFILICGLLLLLASGLEIAIAMGIVAGLGLLFFVEQPISQFGFTSFEIINSFVLTAMPLFIFMGTIFSSTGIAGRLFQAANKWISALPGGVACSVIGANAIFGAMSGSSIAAAATFGKIAVPEMEKLGYKPELCLGPVAVAGGLSVLIPPSILLIVYGGYQDVSVVRLFAAGMIPGVALAMLLMLSIIVQVKLNPDLAPSSPHFTWRERLNAVKEMLPFVAIIILVLGLIFGGIMTATEAAAVGASLSIIFAFLYRRMSFAAFKESMFTAVKVSTMIALLMVTARVLGQVFQYIGLTDAFASFMLSLPLGKYGIFAIICIMYLFLGMFFDGFSMLILTLPFIAPLVTTLGYSPIWFGVTYVVLAEIGFVTPPFGINLFALHGVAPQYDIITIVRGVLPLLPAMLIMVVILVAFPQLALWLPSVLY